MVTFFATHPDHRRQGLAAPDCLSVGVHLQAAFSAVLHYDLAWNPTRHEQRAVAHLTPGADRSIGRIERDLRLR